MADISQHFIKQYEAELHISYQQKASKLRNMVRLKTGVVGSTCQFPIIGTGTAGTKTRKGNVPLMNIDHSYVTATLADYYAADYIDDLDTLKTNVDDRQAITVSASGALGRKVDNLIITALDETTTTVAEGSAGLTLAKISEAIEAMNTDDVPDDGNRFSIVGPHQWEELLAISEFKNADFVGGSLPWLAGTEARTWRGIKWMVHTGLPLATGTRKVFIFHKSAIGLAEAQAPKTKMDWVAEKAAWLIDHYMSLGAVLIDSKGIVEISCDDDAAIAYS